MKTDWVIRVFKRLGCHARLFVACISFCVLFYLQLVCSCFFFGLNLVLKLSKSALHLVTAL